MVTYFCKQAYVDNLQQICRKEFQESSNNFDLLAIVLFALKLFKKGMGKLKGIRYFFFIMFIMKGFFHILLFMMSIFALVHGITNNTWIV